MELLLAVDPATGATRELLSEKDDAWLNLDAGLPALAPVGRGLSCGRANAAATGSSNCASRDGALRAAAHRRAT